MGYEEDYDLEPAPGSKDYDLEPAPVDYDLEPAPGSKDYDLEPAPGSKDYDLEPAPVDYDLEPAPGSKDYDLEPAPGSKDYDLEPAPVDYDLEPAPGSEDVEDVIVEDSRWRERMNEAVKDQRALKIGGLIAVAAVILLGMFFFTGFGTPGSEVLATYAKIPDREDRQMWVLKQVADGNMPGTWNDWDTIKTKGPKGTEVEFESSPHGLRVGTSSDWVEIPLDGPHSAAAAEILGKDIKLATAWMTRQIYLQAVKDGKVVKYFEAPEIAGALEIPWDPYHPDGEKIKSPDFIIQKNLMLHDWLKEHGVSGGTLTAGYFKSVIQPVEGQTSRKAGRLAFIGIGKGKRHRLEIVGGYRKNGKRVQPMSSGHHWEIYFDYSHNIRLVKNEMTVNGETMTMDQFFSSVEFAREFKFQRTHVPNRAYAYTEKLAKWMNDNGYLHYPLAPPDEEK